MIAAVLLVLVVGLDRLMAVDRWHGLDPLRTRWRTLAPRVRAYVRTAPGTYGYLFVLLVTTWVLQTSSSRIAHQLLLERSTNLRHLSRDPLRVLFASAFWVSNGLELLFWIVLFSAIVAPVERLLGTGRTALVFFLGHVGATLLVAAGLWLAIRSDIVESSIEDARDVGASYGFFAVAAVFAYLLGRRLGTLLAAMLVVYVVVSVAVTHDFTNFGHLLALAIGFACRPLASRRRLDRPPSAGDADRARAEALPGSMQ